MAHQTLSNLFLIMNFKSTNIIFFLILALCATGCFYDNQEDLLAEMNPDTTEEPDTTGNGQVGVDPPACDTSGVSYAAFVQPVINAECRSCHNQSSARAGVRLDTYAFIQATALTGQLVKVLNGSGLPLMPPGSKLDDCTILQITAWVDAGAQRN